MATKTNSNKVRMEFVCNAETSVDIMQLLNKEMASFKIESIDTGEEKAIETVKTPRKPPNLSPSTEAGKMLEHIKNFEKGQKFTLDEIGLAARGLGINPVNSSAIMSNIINYTNVVKRAGKGAFERV